MNCNVVTNRYSLSYNDDGSLASATVPYIVNHSVDYTYDTLGRRSAMQLKNGGTAVFGHNYTYDAMSRLATVGNGSATASYTRVPGSNALASTVLGVTGGGDVMTTARTYDNKSRLTGITSTAGATSRGFNYQYDDKDQRIKCTLADGSYWDYSYDAKGQVTGGIKKDASGKAIPGQSFGYAYDDIGNRLSEQRGMAEMLFNYTANNLNQYTQRTVPGIIPITGSAATDATVKVRLSATNSVFDTVRDGAYYKAAVPVNNTASGVESNVEIHAVKFDTAQDKDIVKTITGKYFVDKTPQTFTYDLDGNTLADGKWNFSWDGENRLLSATNAANTQKLEFAYDYQSRRVSKKVFNCEPGTVNWQLAKHERYVYDGWNCIAIFNADDVLQKSMLWGEDLSGSLQGAGGVGGLLAETSSSGNHFPMYNGNGDIMAYIDASGNIVAEYVYDAFGRTILKTGTLADAFDFRFSTKYFDQETGLYYYGYRYYSANMGRWINRDPIGEKAINGLNLLYGFVNNSAVIHIDVLGLLTRSQCDCLFERALQKFHDYRWWNPPVLFFHDCDSGSRGVENILRADTYIMEGFSPTVDRRSKFKGSAQYPHILTLLPGEKIPLIRFVRVHSVVIVEPKKECKKYYNPMAFDFLEGSVYSADKFYREYNLSFNGQAGFYLVNSNNTEELIPGQTKPYEKSW